MVQVQLKVSQHLLFKLETKLVFFQICELLNQIVFHVIASLMPNPVSASIYLRDVGSFLAVAIGG